MAESKIRTEKPKKESSSPAALLTAIAVYALSIGPAAWLDRSRLVPKPVMDVMLQIYFPLDCLYDRSGRFRELFDWYIRQWL